MALTWHTFQEETCEKQLLTTKSNWNSTQSSVIRMYPDKHGRQRIVNAPCSSVSYCSTCYYSGSHAKTRAGSPLSCSQLSSGGQRLGCVNVQRQLKLTL